MIKIITIFTILWLLMISAGVCAAVEPNEPNDTNDIKIVSDVNSPAEPNKPEISAGDKVNKEFAVIFSEYVDDQGNVDYAKLKRLRLELKAATTQLSMLERDAYESWTENEKKAFWINTFNLMMLDIIVDNYPIDSKRFDRLWWPPTSIRHIPPRGDVGTPKWNSYKFMIMDEQFTLYEIEERFFRNEFADPRVFLALTLASMDSPPLRNEPYYGKNLDKQLEEQAKRFLSTPSGFRIDKDKGKVYLSVLFQPKWPWYGNEFLPKYGTDRKFKSQPPAVAAVLNFITNYISDGDTAYLQTGNYTIEYKTYDWRLNSQ